MKHIQRLRRMISLAYQLEWIDRDPFRGFKQKLVPTHRGFLTAEELQKIEELTNADTGSTALVASFMKDLVDRMFVDKEIDAILDANFLQVIKDIDELVQEEYVACTGKQPKLAVFDKDKMGDEIGASLEKDQAIANQFMKDYNKRTSRELADAFRKAHEIPTFEKVAVASADVAAVFDGNTFNDSEDLFSSYPIEMPED